MRIVPYRTMDNRIDGAVLTFVTIGDQKKAQAMLDTSKHDMEQAWKLVRNVFDMNPDPIAVLDKNGRMVIANSAFSELLNIDEKEVKGMNLLHDQPFNCGPINLKSKLENTLKKGEDFTTHALELKTPEGNQRFVIHGQIIRGGDDYPARILLHFVKQPRRE
jgi:two-component system CheB/CheR fusion protein